MDTELEAIDVREGEEYSFDELEEGDKLVNHMDTDTTQKEDFVAVPMTGACADGVDLMALEATERQAFLPTQIANGNGETMARETEGQRHGGNEYPSQESCAVCCLAGLNERLYRGVRLWMIIVAIFAIICAVLIITVAVCSAIYVDEDEQFDRSLFKIPHYFNGSFQILSNVSSTESVVRADFQQKLANLYRSSHALGRYFFEAEIYALRNNSADIEYKLTFVLPEEEQEELRNFILSREMVRNVFRQFLFDQDPVEQGGMYIDPVSLTISSVYMTDVHRQTGEAA